MFYTLIKHEFLTNKSARRVLHLYYKLSYVFYSCIAITVAKILLISGVVLDFYPQPHWGYWAASGVMQGEQTVVGFKLLFSKTRRQNLKTSAKRF